MDSEREGPISSELPSRFSHSTGAVRPTMSPASLPDGRSSELLVTPGGMPLGEEGPKSVVVAHPFPRETDERSGQRSGHSRGPSSRKWPLCPCWTWVSHLQMRRWTGVPQEGKGPPAV